MCVCGGASVCVFMGSGACTQRVGGVLADEMGLGKTLQAIVMMAHVVEADDDGPRAR